MKTIDAQNKSLGRVATEAAMSLMGKDKPTYKPNVLSDIPVHITNVSQLKLSDKKLKTKKYISFTGHPGGLKEASLEQLIEKKGYSEIVKKAIRGMLPNNKLRDQRLKNLTITE